MPDQILSSPADLVLTDEIVAGIASHYLLNHRPVSQEHRDVLAHASSEIMTAMSWPDLHQDALEYLQELQAICIELSKPVDGRMTG